MKSKIAASVSKYLVQQTNKEDGSFDHLEYFFHSMPDLSSESAKKSTKATTVLHHAKSNDLKTQPEQPTNLESNSFNQQVRKSFIQITF